MPTKNTTKTMPSSLEAEQSLLGCFLIDNENPIPALFELKIDDFYSEANRLVFESILALHQKSRPIDYVSVLDSLEVSGNLERIGSMDYLNTLLNSVPSAVNWKSYFDIIKRTSVLRKLISCGQKIIETAYDSDDKETALQFAEKVVFDVSQKEYNKSLEHISGSLGEAMERIDRIAKDPTSTRGLMTGYRDLDNLTNGLQNSDLIIIAARPGVGKTSFAMNLATNIAIAQQKYVAIFPMEMPALQLSQRAVCSVAGVSMAKVLQGKTSFEEKKALYAAEKKLLGTNIYIDDTSMNTPSQILSKCRRLKQRENLDLVVIDYLQLMSSGNKKLAGDRQQEVTEMSRSLKLAARELNVPVVVLSQLSRAGELRKDHTPILSDLRESGAIEQDADIVIFLHRPDQFNDIVDAQPNVCEVIISKHRNGPQGIAKLRFRGETTTFHEMSDTKPFLVKAGAPAQGEEPAADSPPEEGYNIAQPLDSEDENSEDFAELNEALAILAQNNE